MAAWTGGAPAVHIGNVGDFNAQFADGSPGVRRAGGHYACLAAFYSPSPRILVLPWQVEDFWAREPARVLEWQDVEVYGAVAGEDGGVTEGLRSRPALHRRGREAESLDAGGSCGMTCPPAVVGSALGPTCDHAQGRASAQWHAWPVAGGCAEDGVSCSG